MELVLDNSAISLLSCKRAFQLAVVRGLTTGSDAILDMGNAYHKAQEYIDKGANLTDALGKATKEYPSVRAELLYSSILSFRTGSKLPPPIVVNGEPLVEKKFKFKYKSLITPRGESIDIYLAGTIDRIHIEDNILVLPDYKTAADVTDNSVAKKLASYELSFQLPFYIYCLLNGGILPAEYLEYLNSGKYRSEVWVCFYNCKPVKFRKVIKYAYPLDFITNEVPLIINNRILEAANVYLLGDRSAPHDGMNVYKACDTCNFRPACLSMGTAREEEILSHYNQRTYDPMKFR